MVSGFAIVRNAVTLDYPIIPAIRSILALCDEVVVNVGRSEDGTRDVIAGLGDARVRILDAQWDVSRGSDVLSLETNRAMAACRGRWGVCIQADEVLHEDGVARLAAAMRAAEGDARVEGLLVDYVHFYGDVDTVATNRHWYRREVRVVRLDRDVRSWGDAQGFRVGSAGRRVGARATGARMFHYGWARPPASARRKQRAMQEIFRGRGERPLEWTPLLRRFAGTHPRAAAEWVAARRATGSAPWPRRRLRPGDLRYYVSDWIERLTGARVFEYRNYVEV
jgi:hypothetical protein